jgi:hypothetical protein
MKNRGIHSNETIVEMFNMNDELYEDKSTEFILSITADMLNIEYMDVVDALAEANK